METINNRIIDDIVDLIKLIPYNNEVKNMGLRLLDLSSNELSDYREQGLFNNIVYQFSNFYYKPLFQSINSKSLKGIDYNPHHNLLLNVRSESPNKELTSRFIYGYKNIEKEYKEDKYYYYSEITPVVLNKETDYIFIDKKCFKDYLFFDELTKMATNIIDAKDKSFFLSLPIILKSFNRLIEYLPDITTLRKYLLDQLELLGCQKYINLVKSIIKEDNIYSIPLKFIDEKNKDEYFYSILSQLINKHIKANDFSEIDENIMSFMFTKIMDNKNNNRHLKFDLPQKVFKNIEFERSFDKSIGNNKNISYITVLPPEDQCPIKAAPSPDQCQIRPSVPPPNQCLIRPSVPPPNPPKQGIKNNIIPPSNFPPQFSYTPGSLSKNNSSIPPPPQFPPPKISFSNPFADVALSLPQNKITTSNTATAYPIEENMYSTPEGYEIIDEKPIKPKRNVQFAIRSEQELPESSKALLDEIRQKRKTLKENQLNNNQTTNMSNNTTQKENICIPTNRSLFEEMGKNSIFLRNSRGGYNIDKLPFALLETNLKTDKSFEDLYKIIFEQLDNNYSLKSDKKFNELLKRFYDNLSKYDYYFEKYVFYNSEFENDNLQFNQIILEETSNTETKEILYLYFSILKYIENYFYVNSHKIKTPTFYSNILGAMFLTIIYNFDITESGEYYYDNIISVYGNLVYHVGKKLNNDNILYYINKLYKIIKKGIFNKLGGSSSIQTYNIYEPSLLKYHDLFSYIYILYAFSELKYEEYNNEKFMDVDIYKSDLINAFGLFWDGIEYQKFISLPLNVKYLLKNTCNLLYLSQTEEGTVANLNKKEAMQSILRIGFLPKTINEKNILYDTLKTISYKVKTDTINEKDLIKFLGELNIILGNINMADFIVKLKNFKKPHEALSFFQFSKLNNSNKESNTFIELIVFLYIFLPKIGFSIKQEFTKTNLRIKIEPKLTIENITKFITNDKSLDNDYKQALLTMISDNKKFFDFLIKSTMHLKVKTGGALQEDIDTSIDTSTLLFVLPNNNSVIDNFQNDKIESFKNELNEIRSKLPLVINNEFNENYIYGLVPFFVKEQIKMVEENKLFEKFDNIDNIKGGTIEIVDEIIKNIKVKGDRSPEIVAKDEEAIKRNINTILTEFKSNTLNHIVSFYDNKIQANNTTEHLLKAIINNVDYIRRNYKFDLNEEDKERSFKILKKKEAIDKIIYETFITINYFKNILDIVHNRLGLSKEEATLTSEQIRDIYDSIYPEFVKRRKIIKELKETINSNDKLLDIFKISKDHPNYSKYRALLENDIDLFKNVNSTSDNSEDSKKKLNETNITELLESNNMTEVNFQAENGSLIPTTIRNFE